MSDVIKTRMEIKKQMQERNLLFNVESMCEAEDELMNAADYVTDVYADMDSIEEAVDSWIFDTRQNYPETFQAVK